MGPTKISCPADVVVVVVGVLYEDADEEEEEVGYWNIRTRLRTPGPHESPASEEDTLNPLSNESTGLSYPDPRPDPQLSLPPNPLE